MKIIEYVKQKIYDFKHPTVDDMLYRVGVFKKTDITPEDVERLYALIDSYKEKNPKQCGADMKKPKEK